MMTERTKRIWKFAMPIIFVFTLIPVAIYQLITVDKDLVDSDRREKIYAAIEKELKSIEIPDKFTIRDFEKSGKSGSSLNGTITYRTRLPMTETVKQVQGECIDWDGLFGKLKTSFSFTAKENSKAELFIQITNRKIL